MGGRDCSGPAQRARRPDLRADLAYDAFVETAVVDKPLTAAVWACVTLNVGDRASDGIHKESLISAVVDRLAKIAFQSLTEKGDSEPNQSERQKTKPPW